MESSLLDTLFVFGKATSSILVLIGLVGALLNVNEFRELETPMAKRMFSFLVLAIAFRVLFS